MARWLTNQQIIRLTIPWNATQWPMQCNLIRCNETAHNISATSVSACCVFVCVWQSVSVWWMNQRTIERNMNWKGNNRQRRNADGKRKSMTRARYDCSLCIRTWRWSAHILRLHRRCCWWTDNDYGSKPSLCNCCCCSRCYDRLSIECKHIECVWWALPSIHLWLNNLFSWPSNCCCCCCCRCNQRTYALGGYFCIRSYFIIVCIQYTLVTTFHVSSTIHDRVHDDDDGYFAAVAVVAWILI